MTLRPIQPIRHPIDVRVRVPASKSLALRELALSALAEGRSEIDLGEIEPGADVRAMREAIAALGIGVESGPPGTIRTSGRQGASLPEAAEVDARDSGTVAHLAVALAAARPSRVRIDGSPRLGGHSLAALAEALRKLGAEVRGDAPPLTVAGPLRGGRVELTGGGSSETASALLLVAPATERGIELRWPGTAVPEPSIEMTVHALEGRGVKVERLGVPNAYWVGPQTVKGRSVRVDGDATLAGYPAAAAAILGGRATIENVDPHRTVGGQGGLRAFEILERMGCKVSRFFGGITVRRSGALYGIREDMRDVVDAFSTIAVVAACAQGRSELLGLGRLRREESDRVAAVAAGLRALGGHVAEYADGLSLDPAPLHGGTVNAAGDGPVAMAFAILGLFVPGVAVEGAEAVAESFPGFFEMLRGLGH